MKHRTRQPKKSLAARAVPQPWPSSWSAPAAPPTAASYTQPSGSSQPAFSQPAAPGPEHGGDDSEDDDLPPGTTPSDLSPDDYPAWKGRILGRYRFGFRRFFTILEEGIAWQSDGRLNGQAPDATVQAYIDLVKFAPLLPRSIQYAEQDGGLVFIAAQLDAGRSSARSADVYSLKQQMPTWSIFDPPFQSEPRDLLGFVNDTTARCLCPPNVNIDDPLVRAALRDRKLKVDPEDLPRFLWEDPSLGWDSFMRGSVIVFTMRHLYIAPSSVRGSSTSTKKGNAAIHDIRRVTIHSLSYAATMARFVLSGDSVFSAAEEMTSSRFFHNVKFYNHLVTVMSALQPNTRTALLKWYDANLFGDSGAPEDQPGVLPIVKPTSIMHTMMMELKAMQAAANSE